MPSNAKRITHTNRCGTQFSDAVVFRTNTSTEHLGHNNKQQNDDLLALAPHSANGEDWDAKEG